MNPTMWQKMNFKEIQPAAKKGCGWEEPAIYLVSLHPGFSEIDNMRDKYHHLVFCLLL